ncbi:transcriptional regulator [Spongiactinospora rosea]|uniref:Transcriptional regulator n=1 Tax=Spongiactinospora rosea TaxID=2248750 RepID=A0A366M292_9ACTN|nr:helix-turn-helix domain-containing protein [Spongiactinospora rosea]RBQ20147.1 transcriptional regulator [Spongiactinospora rosea]
MSDAPDAPVTLNDVFQRDCPGRVVIDHIAGRWGMLILVALCERPMRFFMLRDRIGGISEKMLSQTLKTLVRDGLVAREVEPSTPPKVTYRLTPLGGELAGAVRTLVGFIGERVPAIMAAQRRYDRGDGPPEGD